MNLVWQRFTLSCLPLKEYLATSYLHRSLVGLLHSWRQSSILMQWGDVIAVALVSLVYAFAPFVSSNLVGLLLVACVGFWFLLTLSDESARANTMSFTPIHLLVLLYWAIAVVSTALSPVKQAAFKDLVVLTLYLLLFALCARVLRFPRLRSWIITLYLHVSLIVSIYGLRQWFFGATALATWVDPQSPLAKTTRVYSYLGNPNLLAGYLVPAVVFSLVAIFAWQSWIKKALGLTMFIANGACLVLTFSRGGWIGLVVGVLTAITLLVYWWIVRMPAFWRTWSLPIILGGMIGVVLLAVIFVEPVRLRVLSIFADRQDSSNNFRRNVWDAVFEMIRDRPIIGIGPGHNSFNQIYPLYQRPRYTALSAYSVFLEVAVETGFVGLGCFLWLIIVTFNNAFLQVRRLREYRSLEGFWLIGAFATLAGMLAHGTVDTIWFRPEVNSLWWLMVALIASYWRPTTQNYTQNVNSSDEELTRS
ncbi:IctB family putative bicarbonate transporter [Umezakia ovalisporum]|jgi:putative inorganic carbon (HCO3(-)) transporter|uniref:IctB family putative bicarbonate transporter n=2 Tax=Umezakia ovalisporum TaxID=75695 RepID=A0AA43GZE0_9CYAN|nr:IctB family putative bicarbonate transporter [Umezakia ovalisporum]MBI1242979.1 putative bicarbonate transporter, IctB family [Nostoc sp. RI_552]MDH6058700.1 IctB family putative bicarbonate transporter [Umezakia ovalisporum FSS-43]MDH6064396.1 IctB family putative bicarbonate transporter [Umezakia ovalisporum FSS-62]MDH6068132.1 IctB family putative bicarbonate transporter [Umezakia ovalisporum APH033B]MDH6069717.1 IctB family putative bicarbonate transporter [Umezakia ovalisporum CobakiLa